MTQTLPLSIVLGASNTGKLIGFQVLNLDRTEYAAFALSTESDVPGTYYAPGGYSAPDAGGYVVVSESDGGAPAVLTTLVETDIEPSGLTAQQLRDAMQLAPSAGIPSAGSIDAHLDDILEDTGSTLPALVSGLDGATVEVVSAVSGGTITVYVADTWRFTVLSDAFSLDGYEKLALVVKRGERATDNEALLYLRSDTGLVRIKGATPVSAANGSLTKTATSFTGVVAVAETQSVRAGQYQWWLKGFDTSPDPDEATTLAIGDFVLKTAGLQAVL